MSPSQPITKTFEFWSNFKFCLIFSSSQQVIKLITPGAEFSQAKIGSSLKLEFPSNFIVFAISSYDDIAKTMKLLGNSSFSDEPILAWENSAPGVISLITCCEDENIKQNLKLDQNSNVLVIGCEGDTDQEMYQKLVNQN